MKKFLALILFSLISNFVNYAHAAFLVDGKTIHSILKLPIAIQKMP